MLAGRYEAQGNMRAGGMSEAHEYMDTRLNRPVIVKTLKLAEERRRLNDEKKALLKLRSNHVVQLLDVVSLHHKGDEIPCLVLEYIKGKDLEEGQFSTGIGYLQVLWQVAKGLDAIHTAGVVHRDIKPNNVRVDGEGVVKIIDFGLSREVGVDNKTRSAIGYMPYMAPELLVKGEIEFSTEADVFAFAVLAMAITKAGLPDWCRTRNPQAAPSGLVTSHLPGVDHRVVEVLQACLARKPKDRPQISDVLKEIEGVLLHDRHKARIALPGKISELDKNNRTATPTLSSGGTVISQLKIEYDGRKFMVQSVVGDVLANNIALAVGHHLPPSCVLAFRSSATTFVYATFDSSNPEYMI